MTLLGGAGGSFVFCDLDGASLANIAEDARVLGVPSDHVRLVQGEGVSTLDGELADLTSTFYPDLYPNPPQHHPTQIDTPRLGFLEIPVYQGILRHHPTPGHPLAGLEQNPAYGTAQAHR